MWSTVTVLQEGQEGPQEKQLRKKCTMKAEKG